MILVGFPAGGAPDAVARAYADQSRVVTCATVIVENRAGASGKIAIDALLVGAADGQTLALIPSSVLALVPMIVKSARYDALRDFITVGSVAEYGFGVAASQTIGVGDFGAFRFWARAQGKAAGYATPGSGTPQHFLGSQLAKAVGAELTHVPYRGGAAARVDELRAQLTKVLAAPSYREAMKAMGYAVPQKQASKFTQVLQAERVAWGDRVRISGFEPAD